METEIKTASVACHDGFDLDLYSWHDEAKLRLESLDGKFVYTTGDLDGERLRSVCYWNDFGCLFFRDPPEVESREGGWIGVRGHVTKSPVIRLPLAIAIRYLFVHGYGAALDWQRWVDHQMYSVNAVNGHLRGWHKLTPEEWAKVCDAVFVYVDNAAAKATCAEALA